MEPPEVARVVSEVQEEFQREIEQGVLQHDLYKATAALGGKDACERILRRIRLRNDVQLRVEPRRREKA